MGLQTSISLPDGLREIIRDRALFNRRSISQEITYLIEVALAVKTEVGRDMIHMLERLSQRDESLPNQS